MLETLWTPLSVWPRIRVDATWGSAAVRRSISLCLAMCMPTGLIAALNSMPPRRLVDVFSGKIDSTAVAQLPLVVVGFALVAIMGLWALLHGVVWIERRGLRLIGRVHGWRVTPEIAWTVCGHASAAAAMSLIAGMAWFNVFSCMSVVSIVRNPNDKIPGFAESLVALLGLAIGIGVALLWFETLVYVGIRKMKFANAPRAVAASCRSHKH